MASILGYKMVISPRSNAIQAPRKSHCNQPTPQNYCSDRCRRERPRPGRSTEADIERVFVRLLGDGRERRVVRCEEVERVVFTTTRRRTEQDENVGPSPADGEGQSGEGEEWVTLPNNIDYPAAIPFNLKMGNRPHTTPSERGMQKAKKREMVRRAARRGVVFGFETEERGTRSVEAVQGGRVVESSLAKGKWGVRWRE